MTATRSAKGSLTRARGGRSPEDDLNVCFHFVFTFTLFFVNFWLKKGSKVLSVFCASVFVILMLDQVS